MNTLTDAARAAFLSGLVAWSSDDMRLLAVNTRDTAAASRVHASEVLSGVRLGWSGTIPSRTVSGGAASAGTASVVAPTSGQTIRALWVVQVGSDDAHSLLIAYFDTRSDGTPVAVVSDGSDVPVDLGAAGWLFTI